MPLQEHPDHAPSFTKPDNDIAWLAAVLSSSGPDGPTIPARPFTHGDNIAYAIEPDLPASSFRRQFLRARIAALGGRPTKAAGHA